jgi:hypothetical protein
MPGRKAAWFRSCKEAGMARESATTRRFGTAAVAAVAVAVALTAGAFQLDLGTHSAGRSSAVITAAEAAAPPAGNPRSPTTGRFVPELD